MLGLALVAEAGCDYRVEVAVSVSVDTAAGKPVVAGTPAALPTASTRDVVTLGASAAADHRAAPRPGPGWYRGDLQSHTYYSDARGSIADLVAEARSRSSTSWPSRTTTRRATTASWRLGTRPNRAGADPCWCPARR